MNGPLSALTQNWLLPFLRKRTDSKRLADRVVLDIEEAVLTQTLGASIGQLVRQRRVDAILCSGDAVTQEFVTMMTPFETASCCEPACDFLASACLEVECFHRRVFPHELIYLALESADRSADSGTRTTDGWLRPCAEIGLPLFISDWEKSDLGDFFMEQSASGRLKDFRVLGSSWEYQVALVAWLRCILQEGRTDVLRVASNDKRGWVVSWEECGERRNTHIVVSDQVSQVEQWFAAVAETEPRAVG
jgi:hypothetical protein